MARQKKNGGEGITWTDETWNPVRGCSRVSEGCRNCYAEKQAARIISMNRGRGIEEGSGAYDGLLATGGQWNGKMELVPKLLDQPLRWRDSRLIFVNSMSDLFHDGVPDTYIDKVFAVMAMADWHTFQILTKRPKRMMEYCKGLRSRGDDIAIQAVHIWGGKDPDGVWQEVHDRIEKGPLPNVWLGVSVENQAAADERIPFLLDTPAAIRWISAEPLLGPLDLTKLKLSAGHGWNCLGWMKAPLNSALDWVVVGGESGVNARPMEREWVRSLRDQCELNGTAFHFKQWGEFAPNWMNDDAGNEIEGSAWTDRMGKRFAGRMLDGVVHDAYPGEQGNE